MEDENSVTADRCNLWWRGPRHVAGIWAVKRVGVGAFSASRVCDFNVAVCHQNLTLFRTLPAFLFLLLVTKL